MTTVTKTGPTVGSGFRRSRLRLQMDRTDYNTYSQVRFRVWVETSNNESWAINLEVWGGWSSNGQQTSSISHSGGNGWSTANRTLVYNSTRNFDRYYGGTTTVDGSARVSGIGGGQSPVSATGSNGISVTIPRRSIESPNNPTGVSVSRQSDTRQNVSWSHSSSAAQPVDRFRIQRHDGLRNSSWRTVTTVGSGSRSWADTSTIANTRYRYRVRAENGAGSSSYINTGYITTTPPGGITPSVRHQGGDNLVTVSRGGANMNVRSEIQHQSAPVGGSWSSWNTIHTTSIITEKNGTVTLRHTNVDATRRHRYRNRLQNSSDSPTLSGSWSGTSSIIELLAPPNAPTNLDPNGGALDWTESRAFSYRHNSVDGTEQTKRQIRSRINGGTWDTGVESPTSNEYGTMNFSRFASGADTEWQVRTWGEHSSPSPWSAMAMVRGSARPEATIVEPEEGGVLNGSSVHLVWDYFDAEETVQAQWQATLYNELGAALEHRTGSGPNFSLTFAEQLEDATTYSVGVRVRDGDRLWSGEAVSIFSTDFALPPAPTFAPHFDPETGATILDINVAEPTEDQVEAAHVQIWRSIGNSREVLIAEQLALGASFTDYTPHLIEPNYYRVVAVSALPSVASTEEVAMQVEPRHRKGWAYFNAGPGFEQVVRVRANADLSVSEGVEKNLRSFAGRPHPVEFIGEHENWSGTLSVRLAPSEPGHATRDHVREIIKLPAPICYRDVTFPSGNRHFVSLGEFGHGQEGLVSEGSIPFTRVEDPEQAHTERLRGTGDLPGFESGDSE